MARAPESARPARTTPCCFLPPRTGDTGSAPPETDRHRFSSPAERNRTGVVLVLVSVDLILRSRPLPGRDTRTRRDTRCWRSRNRRRRCCSCCCRPRMPPNNRSHCVPPYPMLRTPKHRSLWFRWCCFRWWHCQPQPSGNTCFRKGSKTRRCHHRRRPRTHWLLRVLQSARNGFSRVERGSPTERGRGRSSIRPPRRIRG
mmetsp:Transcript_6452/g.13298  ORF Transcript_6452/g.13298 Transcript_6452/m.13298 type:complete len:200 (-) Transcript_6452:61-660(-)